MQVGSSNNANILLQDTSWYSVDSDDSAEDIAGFHPDEFHVTHQDNESTNLPMIGEYVDVNSMAVNHHPEDNLPFFWEASIKTKFGIHNAYY